MDILAGIIVVGILTIYGQTKLHKRKIARFQDMVTDLFNCNDEMQELLRIGMYHKFKENPIQFEHFAAKVIESYYGGEVKVTQASGDFGVDFCHRLSGQLYLGQVKCYAPDHPTNYEPIALIHSQMQKQGAVGGYVITTSHFTQPAIRYYQELGVDIELIDSSRLCQMYIEGLERKKEDMIPQTVIE